MKKSEVRSLKAGDKLRVVSDHKWGSAFDIGSIVYFSGYEKNGKIVFAMGDYYGRKIEQFVHRKNLELVEESKPADPHAALKEQYAKDAKWHPRPWELWECDGGLSDEVLFEMNHPPEWLTYVKYLRKPLIINGIEVPEPVREALQVGQIYYVPRVVGDNYVGVAHWANDDADLQVLNRGLIHLTPEPAAIHGRALASFTEVPQ